jgi:tRNA A-37 threonylcarbamoyl transferase component Bud32
MMARLVLWLLLLGVAWAQPVHTFTVHFHTAPSGLWVYRYLPEGEPEYLGESGKAVALSVREDQLNDLWVIQFARPASPLQVLHTERVRLGDLVGWGRFPQHGQLRLQAAGPPRWWLGLVPLALLALGLRKRLRARPEDPTHSPGVQNQVGSYTLGEALGEGMTSVVYRVHHQGQEVALKLLKSSEQRGAEVLPRFRREMKALSQLRHPHIPWLLDFGEHEGRLYLVMELLSSQTLEDRLPVAWPQAVDWLLQLASAVQAAHQQGVLHRDIKPQNAVFGQDGRLKLSDFGLARDAQANTVTAEGAWLGTPLYMAPELFQGGRATPATDQYALGVLAYEMLSGKVPFQGDSPLAVAVQHMQSPPPDLPEGLPPELGKLVMRMLEKQPEQRFPDLEAVSVGLGHVLSAGSVAPSTGCGPVPRGGSPDSN